jgi:nitronate monooxygenase
MGFVSGGRLAAAVTAAGGLGLIGGGYGDPGWVGRELRAAGNQRVGCGFITWALARQPAALEVALDHRPAAVMLSFGDAAPFLPHIKAAGAVAICQV